MNLYRKRLDVAFIIGLLGTLFFPSFFPSAQLLYFAPFLIILYYKKTFLASLWGSLFCGLILDLLSSESRLGLYTINYLLTTAAIYQLRYNFFSDSISTLPILTCSFTVVSTIIEVIIMMIFDHPLSMNFDWILRNIFMLPFVNALYAFTVFVLPSLLFGKRRLRGNI